jgi:hypothetical protein
MKLTICIFRDRFNYANAVRIARLGGRAVRVSLFFPAKTAKNSEKQRKGSLLFGD